MVPRIEDMVAKVADRLTEIVPEARVVQAHGRLSPTELERIMTEFGDGKHDILLATNIVESGLDMPAVNTLLIHRADMFGLAQLYQLRGRVGRGKLRGYAYLTWPQSHRLSAAAEKRLEVMQTLDNLGAGFTLASHDLDIRGAGNLGEEQSGQIREVGIELYQQMLEEAVADIKAGQGRGDGDSERDWTPQINLGLPVLIPETYVADLPVRLGLYRRIGSLASDGETDAMGAWPTASARCRPRSRTCSRSSPSSGCAAARRGKARCRAEGRRAVLPRQSLCRPGRHGRLGDGARGA